MTSLFACSISYLCLSWLRIYPIQQWQPIQPFQPYIQRLQRTCREGLTDLASAGLRSRLCPLRCTRQHRFPVTYQWPRPMRTLTTGEASIQLFIKSCETFCLSCVAGESSLRAGAGVGGWEGEFVLLENRRKGDHVGLDEDSPFPSAHRTEGRMKPKEFRKRRWCSCSGSSHPRKGADQRDGAQV